VAVFHERARMSNASYDAAWPKNAYPLSLLGHLSGKLRGNQASHARAPSYFRALEEASATHQIARGEPPDRMTYE
jgi:hypothetical protein